MASRKKLFRIIKNLKPVLPKKLFLKIRYGAHTGKKLNLDNPREFNEKINWLKQYYHPPILTQLADKYEVRDYVTKKIGVQYLNEIYGVYQKTEEIDFHSLPPKFVLKAVHGSSTNLIVKDKSHLNIDHTRKLVNKWLKHNQYKKVGYEWAYKNIIPKIIAEKYLEEPDKRFLTDYKMYCFNGKMKFVHVIFELDHKKLEAYFDRSFNFLPFNRHNRNVYTGTLQKPEQFDKIIDLSEKLADRFPFVRVDFYIIQDQIYFGEMTFYPGDGKNDFYPDQYNRIIGDYLKLPELKKQQKEITTY